MLGNNEKSLSSIQILKLIATTVRQQQFVQISDQLLLKSIQQCFPLIYNQLASNSSLLDDNPSPILAANKKDHQFYANIKKLAEATLSLLSVNLNNSLNMDTNQLIGAQIKQKTQNYLYKNNTNNLNPNFNASSQPSANSSAADLQNRKNTRAAFAMRNSKNQQQLKKDQIFVRVIPRTHNCIHFMVKNHNFPRIECRLSCNQHLQYLVTYLTNKWLRGKVGVGYQIKLYPDPSAYMHKHNNEGKRPTAIHQPLNNYLMFTDIMAAFGVAQNGCINLLYDITELRREKQREKQKQKQKQKEVSKDRYKSRLEESPKQNYQIKLNKSLYSDVQISKQCLQTPKKSNQKQPYLNMFIPSQNNNNMIATNAQTKPLVNLQIQSSAVSDNHQFGHAHRFNDHDEHVGHRHFRTPEPQQQKKLSNIKKQMFYHQDQLSIGLGMHHMSKEKKNFMSHNNSIDYSQVNSLGYQFNAFNSNQILGGLFNINNSNTFLNVYDNTNNISNIMQNTANSNLKNNNMVSNPSSNDPNNNKNSNPNDMKADQCIKINQSPNKSESNHSNNESSQKKLLGQNLGNGKNGLMPTTIFGSVNNEVNAYGSGTGINRVEVKQINRVSVKTLTNKDKNINYNSNSMTILNSANTAVNTVNPVEDKLKNIRDIISIVQKQVGIQVQEQQNIKEQDKQMRNQFNKETQKQAESIQIDKQKIVNQQQQKQQRLKVKQMQEFKQKQRSKAQQINVNSNNLNSNTNVNSKKQVKKVAIIKKKNPTQ